MQYYLNKFVKYLPRIVAGLLIFNIFGFDLLTNQTVFLLDYVPTPVRVWDRSYYLTMPWIWMIHDGLLSLLGYIWGSKVYLLSIVGITLLLGYRWGQYLQRLGDQTTGQTSLITIIMMIAMVCNPVFSSRMQTQPGIWLGIVLLGWGCYWLWTCWSTLRIQDACVIGGFRGVAMMTMNHASFMIVLLLVGLCMIRARELKVWLLSGVIALVVGLLNINRIISGLTGQNQIVQGAATFSQQNIDEFMTFNHSGLGPVVTSILGYGFRGEKYGSASAPTRSNPRWWVAGSLLLLLALYGLYRLYRIHPKRVRYVIGLILTSLILGVGIASDVFAPAIQRLYDHLPGYRGLREPHKWIGLYMMCIIPLMGYGWMMTQEYIHRYLPRGRYAVMVVCLMIAWSPGVVRQMYMRYDMTSYPASYDSIRSTLLSDGWTGTMIHLPRHSYHRCQRTNKVISNTLSQYMKPLTLITSDNIEIGQLYTNSADQRSRDIEEFLSSHDTDILRKYQIDGIVYTSQCADFKNYEWITTHTGLSQMEDFGDVQVYKIR